MTRRAALAGFGLCAAIALCAEAAYGYWALALHHFATIREGAAYRSGAMAPDALLATLRQHGIRAVVDLRAKCRAVEAERVALEAAGVRYFNIPTGQVPEPATIDTFLDVVARPENRPVLIHCEHGVGRAPLFEAIYRIEFEGWENERARRSAWWRSGLGAFAPEDEKGRFLVNYVPRRTARGASARRRSQAGAGRQRLFEQP